MDHLWESQRTRGWPHRCVLRGSKPHREARLLTKAWALRWWGLGSYSDTWSWDRSLREVFWGFSEAMKQGQRELGSGQGRCSTHGLVDQRLWWGQGQPTQMEKQQAETKMRPGDLGWSQREDSIWTRCHSPEVTQNPQGTWSATRRRDERKGKGRPLRIWFNLEETEIPFYHQWKWGFLC